MGLFNHDRDCLRNTPVIEGGANITSVKTLAQRLKFARELRRMSQQELASKSGCTQSTIGNIESEQRASLRNLIEVARALKVSPEWLYDGRGPAPDSTSARLSVVEEPPAKWSARPEWPFRTTRAEFDALPLEAKAQADGFILGLVSAHRRQNF